MEVKHHNIHERKLQDGAISSPEQLVDRTDENIETEGKTDTKAVSRKADNSEKDAKETVHETENNYFSYPVRSGANDVERGASHKSSGRYGNEDNIMWISTPGNMHFLLGAILGALLGPLSLLAPAFWRDLADDDILRAKFLLGCSVGIIFQIVGFAIAFSVYKLSSRRV